MINEPIPTPETKKSRGCFFYGCISAIVLTILFGICVFLGVNYFKKLIYAYTDTAPMPLPKVEMPAAEYEVLKKRVESFRDSVDKQKAVEPMILTGDEINALIANGTSTQEVKDKFRVSIEEDKIKGLVSIPLGDTGIPFAKGRYLNGTAAFKTSLQNGVLIVTADSIVVK